VAPAAELNLPGDTTPAESSAVGSTITPTEAPMPVVEAPADEAAVNLPAPTEDFSQPAPTEPVASEEVAPAAGQVPAPTDEVATDPMAPAPDSNQQLGSF
jgi:hypothetical protein